jgi:hypothetical protein
MLEAAGHRKPVSFTADNAEARPDTVPLRAELTVDRSRFGMTWSLAFLLQRAVSSHVVDAQRAGLPRLTRYTESISSRLREAIDTNDYQCLLDIAANALREDQQTP